MLISQKATKSTDPFMSGRMDNTEKNSNEIKNTHLSQSLSTTEKVKLKNVQSISSSYGRHGALYEYWAVNIRLKKAVHQRLCF